MKFFDVNVSKRKRSERRQTPLSQTPFWYMPPILCRFDPFAFLPRCHWLFCHFVPFAIGPVPLCTKSLYVLNAVWDICHCVPNAFHQNASIVPCHLGTNALMRQTPFRDKCPSGSKATGSTKFLLLCWGNIGLKGILQGKHTCAIARMKVLEELVHTWVNPWALAA